MPAHVNLEQFEIAGTHAQVGQIIGRTFGVQINNFLADYSQMKTLEEHAQSPSGRAKYDALAQANSSSFPDYFAELEGIARGAEVPFRQLFLLNVRGEFRRHVPPVGLKGCSDCSLVTNETALIGHNEDGSHACLGNMYLVTVRIKDKPAFTALSYPGFLLGNAFGFNSSGVCFSVDNVRPNRLRVGVGRHFVARSLLESHSLDDAVTRATAPGQAAGFSYTIGSMETARAVVVETSPDGHKTSPIDGAYFHTNHYRELDCDQEIWPSSRARLERALALIKAQPPRDAAEILQLLGDEADGEYPIYRNGRAPDDLQTLCTVLFDLKQGTVKIYGDHPLRNPGALLEISPPLT